MQDKCLKCGAAVVEDEQVCSKCGERLWPESRPERISIFYSYSHKDEDLREELETHLAALKRSGLIREWHDRKIIAGQDWDKEISRHLESAQLVLFLISADFISSSYISDVEVRRALERQSAGDTVVVPVILRPVMWGVIPEFSRLQALPEGARPVTEWPSHDLAFVSVCEGILAVVFSKVSAAPPKPRITRTDSSLGRRGAPRVRRRVLDAALPSRVPLAKPSTLLVMIRRTDSPGLRAIVEADTVFDIGVKDIDSQPLTLSFPVDAKGTPQPLDLTIKIESPQFEPSSQMKNIALPPRGDSELRIFLLTPTQSGKLLVNLEICRGNELVAGCLLRTQGVLFEEEQPPSQSVASASLPMSGGEEEEYAERLDRDGNPVLLELIRGLPHPVTTNTQAETEPAPMDVVRIESPIRIAVIDPSQTETTKMEVPGDVEVGRLVAAMLHVMALPTTRPSGRPNRYQLNLQQPDGRLTLLDEGQTLAQNGVQDDSTIVVTAEATAGCFLPHTMVSVTTERRVQINTLRPGDSVLSYNTGHQRFCSGTVSSIMIDRCEAYLVVNNLLHVSAKHYIFSDRGWIQAGDLQLGVRMWTERQTWMTVESLRTEREVSEVWNLVLSDPENTFVADGIVVASMIRISDTFKTYLSKEPPFASQPSTN